jgi:hypothetical protein
MAQRSKWLISFGLIVALFVCSLTLLGPKPKLGRRSPSPPVTRPAGKDDDFARITRPRSARDQALAIDRLLSKCPMSELDRLAEDRRVVCLARRGLWASEWISDASGLSLWRLGHHGSRGNCGKRDAQQRDSRPAEATNIALARTVHGLGTWLPTARADYASITGGTRIWVSVTPCTVRFVLHDGEEHADKATGERATVPVPTGWVDVCNGHERPERRANRHVEQETPQ